MTATDTASSTSVPAASLSALAVILGRVQQMAESDALLLSGLPATWQYVADGIDLPSVPWFVPLRSDRHRWRPAYRIGASRKTARDGLLALLDGERSRSKAARYLLSQFSGDAVSRLKALVTAHYAQATSVRAPQEWWKLLPVPEPKPTVVTSFLESRGQRAGLNISGESQRVVSYFGTLLADRLKAFVNAAPSDHAGASEAPSGQFFTLNGPVSLSSLIVEKLRLRVVPLASGLVTSVAIDDQKNPEAVFSHVAAHIESEILHDAHRELGMLQEALFGAMVMAGFPLLYWHRLSNGAKPTSDLPSGRRQEFMEGECAAICSALLTICTSTRAHLSSPKVTQDANGRKGILAEATARAGRLAFRHISAIRLAAWAEACADLVNDPDAPKWACIPDGDIKATGEHFRKCAAEITNLLHIITVRNHGLACNLHVKFVRHHEAFNHPHDSRDVASLVREELVKAIGGFDFRTGLRFSTYAYNRIGMELRRRPFHERQLIKLSSDHTTAQPRLWQLANESELSDCDPNFISDLTARYNALYGGSPKANLSAPQVEELLRVGRIASIAPKNDDESEDDNDGIQIDSAATEAVSETLLIEVGSAVRTVLRKFTPAEELALSVLLRVTPPGNALDRFNASHLSSAQGRIERIIGRRATKAAPGRTGLAGRKVRIMPGQRNEKAIRSKLSDELSRHTGDSDD